MNIDMTLTFRTAESLQKNRLEYVPAGGVYVERRVRTPLGHLAVFVLTVSPVRTFSSAFQARLDCEVVVSALVFLQCVR